MTYVNMHDAKTNLSKLVEALVSGAEQEITISRNGKPAVTMRAVSTNRLPRKLGLANGRFTLVEDFDRDDALIQKMFEDGADPYGEKLER